MTDEEKIIELKAAIANAEHGVEVAETDVIKFTKQISESQRLQAEQVHAVLEKSADSSIEKQMDSIYVLKLHKLDHLRDSLDKAVAAQSHYREKLRKAYQELKQIEQKNLEADTVASAHSIFKKVEEFVKIYNQAQNTFSELKSLVLLHPTTDDLIKRAEALGSHACFGIVSQTILSPSTLNELTMNAFSGQLFELVKPGIGSYVGTPNSLKISHDGYVSSDYTVNTSFMDRQTGLGFKDSPQELLSRAEKKLGEVLNRPRGRRAA